MEHVDDLYTIARIYDDMRREQHGQPARLSLKDDAHLRGVVYLLHRYDLSMTTYDLRIATMTRASQCGLVFNCDLLEVEDPGQTT